MGKGEALVIRYQVLVLAVLAIIISILTGYYVKSFEQVLRANSNLTLLDGLWALEYKNFVLLAWCVAVYTQIKVTRLQENSFLRKRDDIVRGILDASCMLMQKVSNDNGLWCIISRFDDKSKTRSTVYHCDNTIARPERTCTISSDFGIAGEAMKGRNIVVGDTPSWTKYNQETQKLVSKDLKCVVAVPVFEKQRQREVVFGLMTYGCSKTAKVNNLDDDRVKKAVQKMADVISMLMRI